ncbi:hypothetical protein H2198_005179 [Neophaeococcomyces mojaviensis]|uniref:Uncharacterized protein n=1 Tax=Neophaeococcomyces mojaviensis TaxID=3383035 RepID=A0ACC3A6E6_9EURO|nr:hypothetical protein H2198_005179 [Knufia sp. JES_112]
MSSTADLELSALGRPSFLGQIYSATTGTLLNDCLFPASVIDAYTGAKPLPNTKARYAEVRNTRERREALDVSASIAVTVMSGALELKGSGSYISRNDTSEASVTVSAVLDITTEAHWLRIEEAVLRNSVAIRAELLTRMGATHVVTAVTYGGLMVASLTETNSDKLSKSDIDGSFSLTMCQSLGALAGAEGETKLQAKEKKKLHNYELEIRLLGDFYDTVSKVQAPVTVAALSSKLNKSGGLLGPSIPVKLTLTPLKNFNKISTVLLAREFEEADLNALMAFYDTLITLSQDWKLILDEVVLKANGIFPTFYSDSQANSQNVELLLIQKRGELAAFLYNYRAGASIGSTASTEAFLIEGNTWLRAQQTLLKDEQERWSRLKGIMDITAARKVPLTRVGPLGAAMGSKGPQLLVLVVIPELVQMGKLRNLFEGFQETIMIWASGLKELNSDPAGPNVILQSIYADKLIQADLLGLDGDKKALALVIKDAEQTRSPSLLSYGLITDRDLGIIDWETSGQEGWGIWIGPDGNKKYIGELRNSQPHGLGIMQYADVEGSSWQGTWFQGARDGEGTLRKKGKPDQKGIWVDDKLEKDGLEITVTMYNTEEVPVDSAKMFVVNPKLTMLWPTTEDLKAVIPAQVRKIARAFGWKDGQRHRLITTFEGPDYFEGGMGAQSDWKIHKDWTARDEPVKPQILPGRRRQYYSRTSVLTNGAKFRMFDLLHDDMALNEWSLNGKPWLTGGFSARIAYDGEFTSVTYGYPLPGEPVRVNAIALD